MDTPNAAVTFEQPGDYRVDVDEAGNTRVSVRQGRAQVSAGGGSVDLAAGDGMLIDGIDSPSYDIVGISAPDGWDRWVLEREQRVAQSRSYEYVSEDIAGVEDLDEHGRWETVPTYGRVWTPTVAVGWAPYRAGQWIWQDPWGWTWVSAEPWGWAPYHYGRWITYSSRWYWVPVARPVRLVTYSPALVAFVGGGPGWSATIAVGGGGGGFVGWFPLAPRDPFIPWWGRRSNVTVNVTNITYVNRTYVTVVNRTTFVGGGVVTNNYVRDRVVLREVTTAPVLRGPLPLVPTVQATRIAPRPGAAVAVRPSAAIVARPVVARIAPPPAPPTFEQKLAVIRTNRGAPVAPAEAAELAVQDRRRPSAATAVRPVAAESGQVTLAPRSQATTKREVRPVASAPVGGRAMATTDRPVASAPVAAPRRAVSPDEQPAREAAPGPAPRIATTPAAIESRGQRPTARPVERPAPTAVVPRVAAPAGEPTQERDLGNERRRVTAVTSERATERPPATPSQRAVQGRARESSSTVPPTPYMADVPMRHQPTPVVIERAAPRPQPSSAAVERAAPQQRPTAAPPAAEKTAARQRPTPKKKETPSDKDNQP